MTAHFRQRPPVFIAAAFVLPVIFCCYAKNGTAERIFPIVLAVSILIAAVVFIVQRARLTLVGVMVLIFALMLSLGVYFVRCSDDNYEAACSYLGKPATVTGRVCYFEPVDKGYTVFLEVFEANGIKVKPFNMKINVSGTVAPGLYDVAEFEVTPKTFSEGYYTGGLVNDYYRSKGIFFFSDGAFKGVVKPCGFVYRCIRAFENYVSGVLDKLKLSSLAKALLIGDRAFLSDEISNIFFDAGAAHVLALSGLHIDIILSALRKVAKICGIDRRVFIGMSAMVIMLYIIITGGSYSVMRAGIMALFAASGKIFKMKADLLNSVSFAIIFITAIEPYSVMNLSFQLSCGAIIGIAALAQPIIRMLKLRFESRFSRGRVRRLVFRVIMAVLSSVAVTASVTLFTLPTMMYYYGNISLAAFLTNIIIIPMMTPVMFSLMIFCVSCGIPFIGDITKKFMICIMDFLLAMFAGTAEFFADMNIPEITVSSVFGFAAAIITAVLLGIAVLMNVGIKKYIIIYMTAVFLCAVLVFYNPYHNTHMIHVISDINCGAVIFEDRDTVTVYKNRGDPSYAVSEYSRRYKKYTVNYLILPLNDNDCRDFLEALYREGISVENIFICADSEDTAKIYNNSLISLNGITVSEYDCDTEFLEKYTFRAQSTERYTLEASVSGKIFTHNTGTSDSSAYDEKHFGDITVFDGCILSDIHDAENAKGHLLADMSGIPRLFSKNYKDTIHDTSSCRTHIFYIDESKITMRCTADGI